MSRNPVYFCRKCGRMLPIIGLRPVPGLCRCANPVPYDANTEPRKPSKRKGAA